LEKEKKRDENADVADDETRTSSIDDLFHALLFPTSSSHLLASFPRSSDVIRKSLCFPCIRKRK
jgi:hypothetical protein